jgi:hypothetical protein
MMKKDINLIQHLDSINKHLININSRLDNIEDKVVLDNTFKIIVILVPIIVGILVFYLTKNKEILFKKAEVAGEIFMRLYNLKKSRLQYEYHYLNQCAFEACNRLENQQNINIETIKYILEIDETDKPKLIKQEIDILAKELMKYIGQYKFYISQKDKIKLEQKTVVIELTHQRYELFENCNSVDEILDHHEKIILNKISENAFEEKIQEMFDEIEKLISKK